MPTPATMVSQEAIVEHEDYTQHTTIKTLPNGDVFTVEKYQFEGGEDFTVEIPIAGTTGTVQYVDENREWHTLGLYDQMPMAPLYVITDEEEWLIEPAFHYEDVGSASIDDVGLGQPVSFCMSETGIVCNIPMTNQEGVEAYYWALQSTEQLIPLDEGVQDQLWAGYLVRDAQRYGYDGYYYTTPSSYAPYTETMFWRNPSAYGPTSFTLTGGSRASDDLSYAWLEILVDNAEPEGYWLTYPKSVGFLYNMYGMEGGFYDTRFNTDITETLFVAYGKTGDAQFLDAAIAQMDFFMEFAANHNYTFEVDGVVGILVEDYYHPTDEYDKTHCSLNHHLAEINTLYHGYEQTGNQDYLDMAELMLQGVRNTRDLWVMDDHGLEYAYMNDGTMGLTDYPFLTYNDLYNVQAQREKMGMERDEALDYLMSEKKIQMDAKGITGYKR